MAYNPEVAPFILPVLFLVSFVAMGIGIWWYRKTKRLITIAKETTGEIIGSQTHTSVSSGKMSSYACVRFVTETGEEFVYRSMVGVPWAGWRKGKKVPILYNPDDPNEARINSFAELTLSWGIFLVTGIGMFCAGLIALGYFLLHP